MRFSGESKLGPIKAMLLALAFPVVYELRSIYVRHKVSALSLLSIGGIFVTGAISLLGLSEDWLAIRRSLPYFAISLALLVSMAIHHPLIDMLLSRVIHMDKARQAANKKSTVKKLNDAIRNAGFALAVMFIFIGVSSYILTLITINSPPKTEVFNSEYARLRMLAIPFTTLPVFAGLAGILMYLVYKIQKLTGIESTELMQNSAAKDIKHVKKLGHKIKKTS
jgi:intracellular septation protein A